MDKIVLKTRFTSIRQFLRCQSGAVTVDWIVLTAAIVMLGAAAAFFVGSAVPELAENLETYMSDYDVTP